MNFSNDNRFGFDDTKDIERFKKRLQDLGCDKKIIVTGPQRSGTRITAKIIADTFQIPYIDEFEYRAKWFLFRSKAQLLKAYAAQAPAIMQRAWQLPKDVAIIVCVRDINDIVTSQKRIKWNCEEIEKAKFNKIAGLDMSQSIAKIKYDYAEKMKDERTIFIKRGLFSEHPLWLPKNKRIDFAFYQTK
jgi:hypothetical protein